MDSKTPAVTCTGCERTWMSASMAEGLRLLGRCPRCGGTLEFADAPMAEVSVARSADGAAALAPHLVMGIPRREF